MKNKTYYFTGFQKFTFLWDLECMYQLINYTFQNVYSPSLFEIHRNT